MCVIQLNAPTVLKTPEEQSIFNRYKKWLYEDTIPDHVVENFTTEVRKFKRKNK
jgi:hypothetical protein